MKSQEEETKFQSIPDDIKRNYRIVKCLLKPRVPNTYIVKTAFLHVYSTTPASQPLYGLDLLEKIIVYLADSFSRGELCSYFNRGENILYRYSSAELTNKANYFRRLQTKGSNVAANELIDPLSFTTPLRRVWSLEQRGQRGHLLSRVFPYNRENVLDHMRSSSAQISAPSTTRTFPRPCLNNYRLDGSQIDPISGRRFFKIVGASPVYLD
jgi:hypothetical protein